jgi:hypothetical protein
MIVDYYLFLTKYLKIEFLNTSLILKMLINLRSVIIVLYTLLFTHLKHGNSSSINWSFGNFIFPNNQSLEFRVTITSPTKPGTYPVIFFLTGLDGIVLNDFYSDFYNDIVTADNNLIISFDKFRTPMLPDKEETLFEITLNWALENLNGFFSSEKAPDSIRNKVFPNNSTNGYTLMSHSAGAHPVCLYLYKHCSQFKKLVWLDPVDGYDPFGIVKEFCTVLPKPLPFQIPTLIVSTGLDPVQANSLMPACKII